MPPTAASRTDNRAIYSVSELVGQLRSLLEHSLPNIQVQGEISNFAGPASGHWYFTLKDAKAQLRCVMFKGDNLRVRPQPGNGDEVLVRGRISVYPARGEMQMYCNEMEAAGIGALLRAFEALKKKLLAEGLFDEARKQPLPALPRRIGIITSGSGAALHDMQTTLRRRWPLARVYLWPVPVQGEAAAPAIVEALKSLPGRVSLDLILLGRGGGSLEDLWAFNTESVARAIDGCPVPVISGVGHETDTTIADFVADQRAATPTAAAELATPDRAEWLQQITQIQRRLQDGTRARLNRRRQELTGLEQRLRLQHPERRLRDRAQRLDDLDMRLRSVMSRQLQGQRQRLIGIQRHLGSVNPAQRIVLFRHRLTSTWNRLDQQMQQHLALPRQRLEQTSTLLRSLSPQNVLDRGYALVSDEAGHIVRDASGLAAGQHIDIRLSRGRAKAAVVNANGGK